jgi:hypothetical protein
VDGEEPGADGAGEAADGVDEEESPLVDGAFLSAGLSEAFLESEDDSLELEEDSPVPDEVSDEEESPELELLGA